MSRKFTKNEILSMERILEKFFSIYRIKPKVPVDIFDLADKIGFDVRGADFSEPLEGIIIVNENVDHIEGFDSNKVIAYDCKKDINSKKFIVGHELAHFIEEKINNPNSKVIVAVRDHEGDYSDDIDEQRKDYLAAAILIPSKNLKRRFWLHFLPQKLKFQRIAKIYKVDIELAKRRVSEVM